MNPTASNNSAVSSSAQAEAQKLNQPLIPAEGVHGLQSAPPDPDRWAVHQVYLRSPFLEPRLPDGQAPKEPTYLYISDFILAPQPYSHGVSIQEWLFDVSDDVFDSLADKVDSKDPEESRSRAMSPSMQILRLRFVREPDGQTIDDLDSWAAAECIWPSALFFMLNEEGLDPRKKLHWGRDMHIDITKLVVRGRNRINVYCMHDRSSRPVIKARIGVESVKLATHSSITEGVTSRVWPAEEVKAGIRSKLGPAEVGADDDGDIMCISSTLQISLLDPMLSRVWTTPVRSKSCRHFESFDLETFLSTRPRQGQSKTAGADHWRCPICNADARPDTLRVDGWLQSVKAELERKRLWGQVKAIVVNADGSWTAKEENASRIKKGGAPIVADTKARATANLTNGPPERENSPPSLEDVASGDGPVKPQEKPAATRGSKRPSSGEAGPTSRRRSPGFVDIEGTNLT